MQSSFIPFEPARCLACTCGTCPRETTALSPPLHRLAPVYTNPHTQAHGSCSAPQWRRTSTAQPHTMQRSAGAARSQASTRACMCLSEQPAAWVSHAWRAHTGAGTPKRREGSHWEPQETSKEHAPPRKSMHLCSTVSVHTNGMLPQTRLPATAFECWPRGQHMHAHARATACPSASGCFRVHVPSPLHTQRLVLH